MAKFECSSEDEKQEFPHLELLIHLQLSKLDKAQGDCNAVSVIATACKVVAVSQRDEYGMGINPQYGGNQRLQSARFV